MSIAFHDIPENFDIRDLILRRHPKLFRAGLNGKTYDRVLEHFCGTLRDLKVPEETIADALSIVQPYREIFEEGATLAAKEKRSEQRTRQIWQGAMVVAILVYAGSVVLARHRK
eukprot:scaffold1230_cov166-Amphora_coffeaeformis.AAC.11